MISARFEIWTLKMLWVDFLKTLAEVGIDLFILLMKHQSHSYYRYKIATVYIWNCKQKIVSEEATGDVLEKKVF